MPISSTRVRNGPSVSFGTNVPWKNNLIYLLFIASSMPAYNYVHQIHIYMIQYIVWCTIYIYTRLYGRFAPMLFCLFVSNKRQNYRTDRVQFFCGTSRDPSECSWMIEFSNICSNKIWFMNFFHKICEIFV